MRHRVAAAAAAALALSTIAMTAGSASAADDGFTFAVIGDIPYGNAQITNFPSVVSQINDDADVRLVTHLGDIKSGSSVCSNEYFDLIKADFDRFVDPLVYTPGDNEWTDCHRANNGSYNPLERLAKIRDEFYPKPGKTLGARSVGVRSQERLGVPENVTWSRQQVAFAALHIVGSNNSLVPWSGLGKKTATPEQLADVKQRTDAAIALIEQTFRRATDDGDRAVALMMQADMFDETISGVTLADVSGFQTLVATIAEESAAFGKPVYLFNGDSHVYRADHPLAAGSSWLTLYGVTTSAPNLTRITVDGSTGVNSWLKVTIHDTGDPLTWTKVPFA